MVDCGPSCTVPSCSSVPTFGFGSAGSLGYGFQGLPYGFGGRGSGIGIFGDGYGDAERAANLGTLNGIIPKPINQVPLGSILTLLGIIVSGRSGLLTVGRYSPGAVGGSGIVGGLGYGSGLLGSSGGFGYGRGALLGRGFGDFGCCCSPCGL